MLTCIAKERKGNESEGMLVTKEKANDEAGGDKGFIKGDNKEAISDNKEKPEVKEEINKFGKVKVPFKWKKWKRKKKRKEQKRRQREKKRRKKRKIIITMKRNLKEVVMKMLKKKTINAK
jgi:hypothetical protein